MLSASAMQSSVTSGWAWGPSSREPSAASSRRHSAAPSMLWARIPACSVTGAARGRTTVRSTQLEPARLLAARRADSWVDKPGSRAAMGSGGAAPEETRSRAGGSPGDADAVALGDGARLVVAGVGVADHTQARVGGEHPIQLLGGGGRAVRYYHHAGVEGPADAHPTAVVEAHPGGAAGGGWEGGGDPP